jgi:hypothetical protein
VSIVFAIKCFDEAYKNYLAFLVNIFSKSLAILAERVIILYMDTTKLLEKIGAALGIVGAFLAAAGFGAYGYPAFTLSSLLLTFTAYRQGNKNLLAMQGAFLTANLIGIYTFVI